MDDISTELLQKLRDNFNDRISSDKEIAELGEKIRNGNATYRDAERYSIRVGEALSGTFEDELSSEVLPDGHMYFNIGQKTVLPILHDGYDMVSDAAADTQKAINTAAGIHLQVQRPEFNEYRAHDIIDKLDNMDQFDDVAWILGDPVVNFLQSVVDETIETNVEFQAKAGLSTKIVRTAEPKCCDWCQNLEGTYDYPIDKEVYRRHENCECVIEYFPGDGTKMRQTNWKNNTWEERKERIQERISKNSDKEARNQTAREERIRKNEEITSINNDRYGKIVIDGDVFVPCLKDTRTGEIVGTVVSEARRSSLKGYNKSAGWYVDWSKMPKDATIYKITVKGSEEIQGLIAMTPVDSHKAMYLNWAVVAPHNNPMLLNGKPKKYEGVGGHLMAIAAEQSIKHGYGGAAYGFAANLDLVKYYEEKFGAQFMPVEHPYEVFYDEQTMRKILETYNYESK